MQELVRCWLIRADDTLDQEAADVESAEKPQSEQIACLVVDGCAHELSWAKQVSESYEGLAMFDRRRFLQYCAAAAGGIATTTAFDRAKAIEPIRRNGQPKFKFSLAAYSYRDLLLPKQGKEPQLT